MSIITLGSPLLTTPANPSTYAIQEASPSANQTGKDIKTDHLMNYLRRKSIPSEVQSKPDEATKKAKQLYR